MMTPARLKALRKLTKDDPLAKELIAEIDYCWGEMEAAKVLLLQIADERNTASKRLDKLRKDITHALGVDRNPKASLAVIDLMVKQAGN